MFGGSKSLQQITVTTPPAASAAPEAATETPPPTPSKRSLAAPDGPLYSSFDLAPSVMRGIQDAGFERCTPIQAQTLPFALADATSPARPRPAPARPRPFLVSMFQTLLKHVPTEQRPGTTIRGIVIAPTRELAVQIHNDAQVLGKHTGLKLACVFGGVDYDKQRRQFENGADILIGTPGRIIDYYKQHVFDLKHVQVCVLDEADRMFDLGFIAGHPLHAAQDATARPASSRCCSRRHCRSACSSSPTST